MKIGFNWFEFNIKTSCDSTDFFSNLVYLRTTPEVVYDRMKVRGRSEETSVSLDYLKQLHDLHEEWLIHGRKYRPAPVIDTIFFPLPFYLNYIFK